MAHKISKFYTILNNLDGRDFIEKYISYNVALISAGVKPSITLNIKKENNNKLFKLWIIYGEQCLKELSLKSVVLRESNESIILLIYNANILGKFLNKKENKEFLESIGYNLNDTIQHILMKLIERYNIYNCPHELGIFLGYPIDDVKGFINCSRAECIFCGYWKVYKNEERARTVFKLFDDIRISAIDSIMMGIKGKDISVHLRSKFNSSVSILV